jgi:hypothetical protein
MRRYAPVWLGSTQGQAIYRAPRQRRVTRVTRCRVCPAPHRNRARQIALLLSRGR